MERRTIETLIAELKRLKVREAEIISELEETVGQQRASHSEGANTTGRLSIGDRVRITNRVRRPANWTNEATWEEEKERRATVTKVTPDQVHIVTDNGVKTWRAPNNLKKC